MLLIGWWQITLIDRLEVNNRLLAKITIID